MKPVADETVWTIVVAGGSGSRFGAPKQYELIGAQRMLDRSVALAAGSSDGVVVVVPPADVERETARLAAVAGAGAGAGAGSDAVPPTPAVVVGGGATRSGSVRAGLAAVPASATIVCVHDAARPFAGTDTFAAVVDAVAHGADGAIPGIPVTDTIKVVDADGVVTATPDRATLVAVQTPQAFRAAVLRCAHEGGGEGTDDAALVEALGGRVVVVVGHAGNRKITHPDDLAWARAQVAAS